MTNNLFKRIITSLILITILFISLFLNDLSWKLLIIIFSLLCFYEFYNLINKIFKNKILILITLFLIALYLYYFYFLLINIRIEFGEEAILILLITCILSDIGGYVTGKLLGGPKLTKISPNKTISGAAGSVIFTILGSPMFVYFLKKFDEESISLEISAKIYIWFLMMSIFCQVGDLLISYLKRKAKVEDTGAILPGHGGILDRVDGIIFAIPLGVLAFFLLELSV